MNSSGPKKSRVLIVAPYSSLPGEKRFNRFLYIAKLLQQTGHEVVFVTSRFAHSEKRRRLEVGKSLVNGIEFHIIDEPGYQKNVSLQRIKSIRIFEANFSRWLEQSNKFDLVYSAYPLMGTNSIIAKLKRTKRWGDFSFVIDIQDIWPDSITSALPALRFGKLFFKLFHKVIIRKTFRQADQIVAVSKTYLDWANGIAGFSGGHVIYIGSNQGAVRERKPGKTVDNVTRLFYIGSLGNSYDLETPISAVLKMIRAGKKVELHIIGGSEQEIAKLRPLAHEGVFFHGYVHYKEMFDLITTFDIAINPIRTHAAQSITNKLSDYFSIGCPILNSQKNQEVLNLLKAKVSQNYTSGNAESFVKAFYSLIEQLKSNSVWEPDTRFLRDQSYLKIVKLIDELLLDETGQRPNHD